MSIVFEGLINDGSTLAEEEETVGPEEVSGKEIVTEDEGD